jgi:hypothetical protein
MTDTLHQGLHAKPTYCGANFFYQSFQKEFPIILSTKFNCYTEKEK